MHITPIGELDLATAGTVADQLDELLDAGFDQLVIDLHRLSFIDSAGLRTLITAGVRARRRGAALEVVCARGQVKRILALTGVDHQLGLITGHRYVDARRSHGRGASASRASAETNRGPLRQLGTAANQALGARR